MAVFLYGIFFLTGKNAQYSGITCPKCQNSIFFNISGSLDNFINSFALFETPNGKTLACDLRYFSSASSLVYQNCFLEGFDAYFFPIKIGSGSEDNFHGKLSAYTSENQFLDEKYFCSYVWNSLPPIGDLASIFWYKENEIEFLLSIENECKIKIFPRYYFDGSVFLALEKFCWEQYLIEEFSLK